MEDLARRVRDVRFGTTRLRPGYDEKDVDAFLDEMAARAALADRQVVTLRAFLETARQAGEPPAVPEVAVPEVVQEPVTSANIRNKRFTPTRLRPGYAQEEVRSFLRTFEEDLEDMITERDDLLEQVYALLA